MSDLSPPSLPPPPPPEFPPIEPSNFDLIVVGTSLPSSILSAAASSASKTVLHLDPNPFYGSLFASLSPPDLSSLLSPPPPPPLSSSASSDFAVVPLSTRPLFSAIDFPPIPPELQPHARKLALDVSGPRVLFSADAAIELLLKSGVSNYLEFKGVDESLIYDAGTGRLVSVPDSRAAIFKDKKVLTLTEKGQLMKLYKNVQRHLSGDCDERFSDEDLESPFFEFLSKQGLSDKIKRIVLYALALADHDQENVEACKDLLRTKDGISRLALYHSSIGRFPNAHGAMLYPMYGQGELPQAFCRRAAVKGCIYVLRMSVSALLADKDSGVYRGVRLASGQDLFSQKLILDPDLVVPEALASSSTREDSDSTSNHPCSKNVEKVARAICITRTSLRPDVSNLLIVLPPRSLYPEQATSVRAIQLSSNSAVCPAGMYVVHLSVLCDEANQGETLLKAAMDALFRQPTSESTNSLSAEHPNMDTEPPSAVQEEQPPLCEWRTLYIQDITEGSVHTISTSPSPDGNLSYNDLIGATEKMFRQMFPGEGFYPEQASSEDTENGEAVDPEL